ncbi:hypothetical protein [Streptomyces palmae]|uniref:DUF2867 domain-containing protein n=1 Tax=Streptomyces palmae TaxID=1701085 RepID=A0A4Z0H8S8_9ACTN|nr:hypothetical protein [Streptomyces palmae]TGB13239.1 hypothetical protein E4099_10425 [Streptomyces palmae]
MELDRLLPVYDFRSHYRRRVAADPETTWGAYRSLTAEELPTVRLLMSLRGLGRRRLRGPIAQAFPVPLLSTGDHAEVRGQAAKYWRPRPAYAPLPGRDPEAFRDFGEAGWAKAAIELRVVPDGDGSVLIAETRVRCTDSRSRALFAPYWMFIKVGGAGLIRLEMLRAVARRAERSAAGA